MPRRLCCQVHRVLQYLIHLLRFDLGFAPFVRMMGDSQMQTRRITQLQPAFKLSRFECYPIPGTDSFATSRIRLVTPLRMRWDGYLTRTMQFHQP